MENPNVFSLPGEADMKKFISLLFSNSKKDSLNDKHLQHYIDGNILSDGDDCDVPNIWKDTLKVLVNNDPKKKQNR